MPSTMDSGGLVFDHWRRHAERTPERTAVIHWVAGETPFIWQWGPLLNRALHYAAQLSQSGVDAGQVSALLLRHHREFYPLYLGVAAIGALPAVLACPNDRVHPDKYRSSLQGMAKASGLDWVLTTEELAPVLQPLVTKTDSSVKGILLPFNGSSGDSGSIIAPPASVRSSDPCLLQHSSGTTGLQKPVILSHMAVLEHIRRYGNALDVRSDDVVVSWLPLYHDMGLIACFYLPLTLGIPMVQLDAFEWVTAPVVLLEAISAVRGTVCWLPNFAYNHMSSRIDDRDLGDVRLDTVRLLVNCSEPIRAASHDRFFDRFARLGFRRDALGTSYAMAETTFAATQSPVGKEARRIAVRAEELSKGSAIIAAAGDAARVCVSSGAPIGGCDIRIVDAKSADLPDDRVGEIAIRSVSLFGGYRGQPDKTARVLRDGWYFSGDLGFRHDGEIYVIGRGKDLIIVAGKNIYPEDIEDAVGVVPGIIPGRIVAFALDDANAGTEQIAVVAETNAEDDAGRRRLRRAVIEAGMAADVTIATVYLAPPRWLIKSTSGKPSRRANKERALNELHGK